MSMAGYQSAFSGGFDTFNECQGGLLGCQGVKYENKEAFPGASNPFLDRGVSGCH